MTAEELRDEIKKMKLSAFDYAVYLTEMSAQELINAGQRNRTGTEAAARHIEETAARIEAKIRKYEKENP